VVENNVPGETVMAMSSLAFAARCAQEKLKIPAATVHLAPSVFRSVSDPPRYGRLPNPPWPAYQRVLFRLIDFFGDRAIGPRLNAFRGELGLPPVARVLKDYWHSPQSVIGFFPKWFAAPQPEWPAQTKLVGFPLFDEKGITP